MKAYNAIYQHGFFFDKETKKRILLKEGSEISITIEQNDLHIEDPYNKSNTPKSKLSQLMFLRKKKYIDFIEIKKPGECLYFEIKVRSKEENGKSKTYLFELTLKEFLLGARKENKKDYDLGPCECVVSRSLDGQLPYFEPIYGYSLNDAYMKTFDFYFRLYGKPTANVKTKMMEKIGSDKKFLKKFLDNLTNSN